jgi:hypothetical protein
MPTVTILKQATGRATPTSFDEANDAIAAAEIARTVAGTATLWGDAFTSSITIGATGTPVTVDDNLIVSGEVQGPDDGTGIVIGAPGTGASGGSTAQLVSLTTAERDFLVGANGMMIYNESALTAQVYNDGSWTNFPEAGGGDASTQVQPGIVSLGTLLDYPASGGSSASEIQYVRVFLFAGVTYDAMQVFQESGGAGTRDINLGIYDQATPGSTTGTPNNRVAETGSTATAGGDNGTFVEIALTSPYLIPTTGYYWLAIIPDSANLKFAVSSTYRADYIPVRRESGTAATLPASAGTLTNPSSAVIWVGAVEQ